MNRKEFEQTLVKPVTFWGTKTKQEVQELLGPETAKMVGYKQKNPHHCYDLYFHTLHTIEGVGADAPTLLQVAAFFHDIGKPEVAKAKAGRLVFYNHAEKSVDISKPILEKMGYLKEEIQEILFYIKCHDAFISWDFAVTNPYMVEISEENVRVFIEKKRECEIIRKLEEKNPRLWNNLFCLCKADAGAQAKSGVLNGHPIATPEEKQGKLDRIEEIFRELGYSSEMP